MGAEVLLFHASCRPESILVGAISQSFGLDCGRNIGVLGFRR